MKELDTITSMAARIEHRNKYSLQLGIGAQHINGPHWALLMRVLGGTKPVIHIITKRIAAIGGLVLTSQHTPACSA